VGARRGLGSSPDLPLPSSKADMPETGNSFYDPSRLPLAPRRKGMFKAAPKGAAFCSGSGHPKLSATPVFGAGEEFAAQLDGVIYDQVCALSCIAPKVR
jgi:hypothetical protein